MLNNKNLENICQKLKDADFTAYLVGGSVRDIFIGKQLKDFDLTTNARPEEIERVFPDCYSTIGVNRTDLGTRALKVGDDVFEITPYRRDGVYKDNRRPETVEFGVSLEDDLSRRDFTINAMAFDPLTDELVDPFGGREDIRNRVIRCVGDADARFQEDALRILRAIRFSATLDFIIDFAGTGVAMKQDRELLYAISAERKRDELMKMMGASPDGLNHGLTYLLTTHIMEIILPEFCACMGVEQEPTHHSYDVGTHLKATAGNLSAGQPLLRLAGLLHDIGKPQAKTIEERPDGSSIVRFLGHEDISAAMANVVMQRFRFSAEETDYVVSLIANHVIMYDRRWSDTALRRFIRKAGADRIFDLLLLREADVNARGKIDTHVADCVDLRARITKIMQEKPAVEVRDLAVDGHDVMRVLGIPPSPAVGKMLESLMQRVLETPADNNKERLEQIMAQTGGTNG